MLRGILTTFGLWIGTPAWACECRSPTACELVQNPVVFIGDVIAGGITSLRDDPWDSDVKTVRFRVVENFKGLPTGVQTVDVALQLWKNMCSPIPYYQGRRYLVTPRGGGAKAFTDGNCFSGRDVEHSRPIVDQVRDYFAGRMSNKIVGETAAVTLDRWSTEKLLAEANWLYQTLDRKHLEDIEIRAFKPGFSGKAISDAHGRFVLDVPSGGQYLLQAWSRDYQAEAARHVTVDEGRCSEQHLSLATDNTISGSVWNHQGQKIKKGKVGLIDLDRPAINLYGHPQLVEAHVGQKDATFELQHVPVGRYLLMFNPEGPQWDSLFESTFYPLGSSRAEAKIIEVRSNGVHLQHMDLKIGAPVVSRNVAVKVTFPDGASMTRASVGVFGEALGPGEFAWKKWKVVGASGVAYFGVPSNRKVRIEVRDWHFRDLKANYQARYEPGTQPIVKNFVIKP